MDKKTFRFPYKGITTEGHITATNGGKMLIDGAFDARGMFFVKEGNNVQLYFNRKLALDACMCGSMDGWAEDDYEYNHPITGGPPEYHAGINQSTKAPKEYPGATEADLANPKAGIDDLPGNIMRNPEPGSTLEQDGGPGSGQKGHGGGQSIRRPMAQPQGKKGHISMHAYHPSMEGPQHRASASNPQEAAQHLGNLWKQYPEHNVTFHATAGPNMGMTHNVKPNPGKQAHELVPHHLF